MIQRHNKLPIILVFGIIIGVTIFLMLPVNSTPKPPENPEEVSDRGLIIVLMDIDQEPVPGQHVILYSVVDHVTVLGEGTSDELGRIYFHEPRWSLFETNPNEEYSWLNLRIYTMDSDDVWHSSNHILRADNPWGFSSLIMPMTGYIYHEVTV